MYSQIFLVQVLQEILPRKNACWKVLPKAKKVPFIFKDISESIGHTKIVQLSTESWQQDVSNEECNIAVQ